jgi:hypothetical protein
MNNGVRGFIIVDEADKYVVGYAKDNDKLRYIAHDKNDNCAIRVIPNRESALKTIDKLNKISVEEKDNHIFRYIEVK